jgi:succinyl-CoA synthetase beta subunit
VAVISFGAGFTMALLDLLADSGIRAANFCDTKGGSSAEVISAVSDLILWRANHADEVRAILINLSLTATPLENAIDGLQEALRRRPTNRPIFGSIRAYGPSVANLSLEAGVKRLEALGARMYPEISDAVAALSSTLGVGTER